MKIFFIAVGAIIVLAVASIFVLPKGSGTRGLSDPDIVASSGMHWHPVLAIYVKGETLEIPANIGIGVTHLPIHTHDEDAAEGVIHLEFPSVVRKEDIMLGNFFRNWGKDMRSFGQNMRMTVNGKENTEYENYVMHDGDRIELHYE